MLSIYTFLLGIGFAVAAPFFLWRGRGTNRYTANFKERFGALPVYLNVDGDRSIWIHAVSVGEVLASRILVEPLKKRFPRHRIFLSTSTVAGNAVARQRVHGIDGLFYAPFDFPSPVRKVLDTLKPDLLVIVETELWPNLIHEAHVRGTKVALVNGRISPRSYPRYRQVRALLKGTLSKVDAFFMQAEPHAERIRTMGAPESRVKVTGNLKFDALDLGRPKERLARIILSEPARPIVVAGSTVPGEEEIVLKALRIAREKVPDLGMVLAPRHPDRFAEVPAIIEAAGFKCARRTDLEPGQWKAGDVLLLDTLGELASVFSLATVGFVGGSLLPQGGHNVLEVSASGVPVLTGPNVQNFQEIANEFHREGALVFVKDATELAREIVSFVTDKARRNEVGGRGRALIEPNRGALGRTVDGLSGLIEPSTSPR
jgi:3-deoxy-D-manno-octulosonic-acid transferase